MRYLVAMQIIYENAELNLKRDLKSRRKLHIFGLKILLPPFKM